MQFRTGGAPAVGAPPFCSPRAGSRPPPGARVSLRAEAHMAMGCAAEAPPVPTHRLIFDRPFLILLQRAEAKAPHFALWVGSGELLVRP